MVFCPNLRFSFRLFSLNKSTKVCFLDDAEKASEIFGIKGRDVVVDGVHVGTLVVVDLFGMGVMNKPLSTEFCTCVPLGSYRILRLLDTRLTGTENSNA